jgi:hypothetical protein
LRDWFALNGALREGLVHAIGRLSDRADLVIGGENLGAAQFDLVVFEADNAARSARGKLNCDYNLPYRAFADSSPLLLLKSGKNMRFAITELSPDGADIVVNSDIPGFS